MAVDSELQTWSYCLSSISHHYSCFISDLKVFFGTFFAPIFAILLFNVLMFVLVAKVLIQNAMRKLKDENHNIISKTFVSIVGVTFLFGLSWIFAACTVKGIAYAFQILFIIFNSTQGFFLFIFICVLNPEIRQGWFHLFYGDPRHSTESNRVQLRTGTHEMEISKMHTLEPPKSSKPYGCVTCDNEVEDEVDSEVPPQVSARWPLISNTTPSFNTKVEEVHSESDQIQLKTSAC